MGDKMHSPYENRYVMAIGRERLKKMPIASKLYLQFSPFGISIDISLSEICLRL